MVTDLFLYLLIALVFVGFFLMLLVVKDSQTEAEQAALQHSNAPAHDQPLIGYGILAGIYLVLFVCAFLLRNRQA